MSQPELPDDDALVLLAVEPVLPVLLLPTDPVALLLAVPLLFAVALLLEVALLLAVSRMVVLERTTVLLVVPPTEVLLACVTWLLPVLLPPASPLLPAPAWDWDDEEHAAARMAAVTERTEKGVIRRRSVMGFLLVERRTLRRSVTQPLEPGVAREAHRVPCVPA
jgi:hypothetical protein